MTTKNTRLLLMRISDLATRVDNAATVNGCIIVNRCEVLDLLRDIKSHVEDEQ
ncbi:MAG: hypothetical protein ACYTBZ_29210 [Planctomycetota bacterium]